MRVLVVVGGRLVVVVARWLRVGVLSLRLWIRWIRSLGISRRVHRRCAASIVVFHRTWSARSRPSRYGRVDAGRGARGTITRIVVGVG